MFTKESRNATRVARHSRVRKKVFGTRECPRLCVFRSSKNIYAQAIDDVAGATLCAISTLSLDFASNYGGNKKAARALGVAMAAKALAAGIKSVVFDRGGYVYQGRVLEFAEGAREGGLDF